MPQDGGTPLKFENLGYHSPQNYSMSPNNKLLAVSLCMDDYQDPVDDEWKYKNFIIVLDVDAGKNLGSYQIDSQEPLLAKVEFSEDGKSLFILGRGYQRQVALHAKP